MEAATQTGPARAAAQAPTLAHAFRITVSERPDEVAIRTKEDAFTITWGELRERVWKTEEEDESLPLSLEELLRQQSRESRQS